MRNLHIRARAVKEVNCEVGVLRFGLPNELSGRTESGWPVFGVSQRETRSSRCVLMTRRSGWKSKNGADD